MSDDTYDKMAEAINAHVLDVYGEDAAMASEWVMAVHAISADPEAEEGYLVETSHHSVIALFGLAELARKKLLHDLPAWDDTDDDDQ